MHYGMVALFLMTAGLTTSGIVANVYRLLVGKKKDGPDKAVYLAVMVVAGPSVLFDKAARSRRKKECSNLAFAIAAAIALYWSFALGMFIIEIVTAVIRR